jgi:hypothetical protein
MIDHRDTPVTANWHLDPRDDEYPNPCDLCRVHQVRGAWISDLEEDDPLLLFVCHTCLEQLHAVNDNG